MGENGANSGGDLKSNAGSALCFQHFLEGLIRVSKTGISMEEDTGYIMKYQSQQKWSDKLSPKPAPGAHLCCRLMSFLVQ